MERQREVGRLRSAAALVQEDLRRTLGTGWLCAVDDDFTLRVGGGGTVLSVPLGADLDEDALPIEWDPEDEDDVLDDEAETCVAEGVQKALEGSGFFWPFCAVHEFPLGVCGGTWICGSDDEHDVAPLGRLTESHITRVPRSL